MGILQAHTGTIQWLNLQDKDQTIPLLLCLCTHTKYTLVTAIIVITVHAERLS